MRTVLACASGGTASDGAIEIACRLARRFNAHLEGFHVRLDARALFIHTGAGMGTPLLTEWCDQLEGEAAEKASRTAIAFAAAVDRHGLTRADHPPISGPSASWHEEIGYAPALVPARARFFDLAVLGRSERVIEQPHTDVVEETLLRSGRPVLLAPAEAPATMGDTVAFGWNGSVAAVRVLAASLPLLSAAHDIVVIDVGERSRESALGVIEYLHWQGIAARRRYAPSISGLGAGEQLLATARDEGADLLIMGGYGHTPWRQTLFGGATREVVGTSLLPVLLSH